MAEDKENGDPHVALQRPSDRLEHAIEDALLSVEYSASRGIELEEQHIAAVLDAAEALRNGSLSKEQEKSFWLAGTQIAKQLDPVSIDSISACLARNVRVLIPLPWRSSTRRTSLARQTAFNYLAVAVITLLVVVVTQAYLSFGSQVLEDTLALEVAKNETVEELSNAQLRLDQAQLRYRAAVEELAELEARASQPPGLQDEATQAQAEVIDVGTEVSSLMGRLSDINGRLTGTYHNLGAWTGSWVRLATLLLPLRSADLIVDEADETVRNSATLSTARVAVEATTSLFLTSLYGLLGASAHVLRRLSADIRAVTFLSETRTLYRLRLIIGLLAGLAIGLFVGASEIDVGEAQAGELLSFKTLAPPAIAFLAGYSVELLFAALDRIITAFTGRSA